MKINKKLLIECAWQIVCAWLVIFSVIFLILS